MSAGPFSTELVDWVKLQLEAMIGASEFATVFLGMPDDELRQYATNVLGDTIQSETFVNELISRRNRNRAHALQQQRQPNQQRQSPPKQQSNRKQQNSNQNNNKNNNKKNKQQQNQQQNRQNKQSKQNKQNKQRGKQQNKQNQKSQNVMNIDPDEFYATNASMKKSKNQNNQSQSNPSKYSNEPTYRQSGAMTITHGPVSKKDKRRKEKFSKQSDGSSTLSSALGKDGKSSKLSKSSKTQNQSNKDLTSNEIEIINEYEKKYGNRRQCGCQGVLHESFKNCTECGYIVCLLEGEGPCFNCGSLVTISGTVPFEPIEIKDDIVITNESNSDDTVISGISNQVPNDKSNNDNESNSVSNNNKNNNKKDKNKNKNGSNDNNNNENPIDKEAYDNAVKMKNKLLDFARNKALRTRVIDDQGDFYETEANSIWRSDLERERAREKAFENEEKLNKSRADVAIEISLDLSQGGIVYHENDDYRKRYIFDSVDREEEIQNKIEKDRQESKKNREIQREMALKSYYQNASLTGTASQVYATMKKLLEKEREDVNKITKQLENSGKLSKNGKSNNTNNLSSRVADGSYVEQANDDNDNDDIISITNMTDITNITNTTDDYKDDMKQNTQSNNMGNINNNDVSFFSSRNKGKNQRKRIRNQSKYISKYDDGSDKGVCLSMHQPWASLLVYGIKRVEGRSWSTKYRGRLWIASAKRVPTPMEIAEVEEQYCQVYNMNRNKIPFPKEYPTAALLGCVDLVNCLTLNEYENKFIDSGKSKERNASANCFICEYPRRLVIPGAITGEHKLWKMPIERIKPMQQGLIPVELGWMGQVLEDRSENNNNNNNNDNNNENSENIGNNENK